MDARKIAHLESFSAFIEFLTNPDEYRQIIKDTRKAVEEWREVNEKARGIKDVEAWRVSVQKELDARQSALESRAAALDRSQAAFDAMVAKRTQALDDEQARQNERLKVIEAKTEELNALMAQKPDMDLRELRLASREAELSDREAEVKDRISRLSRAMEA